MFCDFYIEYSKSITTNDAQVYVTNRQILFYIMESFLRLLHPIMPYITEELYQKLFDYNGKKVSISLDKFPEIDSQLVNLNN